ncbi:MAG: LysR family transcriptional regulator [Clostridia bacterium]|nr:LysR family transcriptional regulator [Clostridia bacterium]
MKIKKYEAFISCCECKSISETAKKFGNSQSSITQLISSLEKDLGFKLLVRNKGGVRLTDEGRLIYNAVKKVVEDNERVREIAAQINAYNENTIRVGAFKSIAVNWLPHMIKEFGERHKNVNFSISDGHYSEIEEKLRNNEIDVGFVSMPFDEGCICFELIRDELLAVLPKNHGLANEDSVSVSRFGTEAVVSLIDSTDHDARAYLESYGITPNTKFKTADDYAMISMVENELGICIAHELVMEKDNHNVLVKSLEPKAYRKIGLAVPDYSNKSAIVREFSEFVREWVNRMKK